MSSFITEKFQSITLKQNRDDDNKDLFSRSYKRLRTEMSRLSSIKNQKLNEITTITIHVWSGAEFESSTTGGQRVWFQEGLQKVTFENPDLLFVVEYRSNKGIRENEYSIEDMFEWLWNCDIHYILTHVHQGITLHRDFPDWNIPCIINNLNNLELHTGFPSGDLIKCPVFQQDKFKYVDVFMQKGLALPTLKIFLNDETYENIRESLTKFIEENAVAEEGEICRWVLKVPFTTNHPPYQPIEDIERIISRLKSYSKEFYGVIPYVMLQRCLLDRHEVKVSCINGQPLHSNHKNYSGNRHAFPDRADDDFLFAFAKRAIVILKDAYPEFLTSGLTRVDIMYCAILDQFYVNEVESLEAGFDSRHKRFAQAVRDTQKFLMTYHYDILSFCISQVVNMHIPILK